MGRKERRELERKVKHLAKTRPWELNALIADQYDRAAVDSRISNEVLAPGDKVMLDVRRIMSDPDWMNFKPEYQQYVMNHAGEVFTLKKEARQQGPFSFVSFEEDETDPKWLWFTGFIKRVNIDDT